MSSKDSSRISLASVKDSIFQLFWWWLVVVYTSAILSVNALNYVVKSMNEAILKPVATFTIGKVHVLRKVVDNKREAFRARTIEIKKSSALYKKSKQVLERLKKSYLPYTYELVNDRYDILTSRVKSLTTFEKKSKLWLRLPYYINPFGAFSDATTKVATSGMIVYDILILWVLSIVFASMTVLVAPVGGTKKLQDYRKYKTMMEKEGKVIEKKSALIALTG